MEILIKLEDCFAKRKELFLHAQKQSVPKRKAKVAGAECLTLIAVVMGLFAVYKNFSEINASAKTRCKKYSIRIALISNCSICKN